MGARQATHERADSRNAFCGPETERDDSMRLSAKALELNSHENKNKPEIFVSVDAPRATHSMTLHFIAFLMIFLSPSFSMR